MSEQSGIPGGDTGANAPHAGKDRDLSFLWPVIDRIRAIEIKFVAEDAAGNAAPRVTGAPQSVLEARLQALEGEAADPLVVVHHEHAAAPLLPTRYRGPSCQPPTVPAPPLGSGAPSLASKK